MHLGCGARVAHTRSTIVDALYKFAYKKVPVHAATANALNEANQVE